MSMAYEQIEPISVRKGEKVAAFLTIENAAGLLMTVLPAYLLSGGLPLLLRALVLALAAAVGIAATLEFRGLALYERLLWRGRGMLRVRLQGRRVTPEQLVGAPRSVRPDRPLAVNGPIRVVKRQGGLLTRLAPPRAQPLVRSTPQAVIKLRLPASGHIPARPEGAEASPAAQERST
jgi:hypothetical protein